jgi:HK97 family phage major capsid protein
MKERRGASFVMSPSVCDHFSQLRDASGRFYSNLWSGRPMTWRGLPVLLSQVMPAMTDSAASTPFVALGNMKHIIYGVRLPFESKFYDQTMYAVRNDQVFLSSGRGLGWFARYRAHFRY